MLLKGIVVLTKIRCSKTNNKWSIWVIRAVQPGNLTVTYLLSLSATVVVNDGVGGSGSRMKVPIWSYLTLA